MRAVPAASLSNAHRLQWHNPQLCYRLHLQGFSHKSGSVFDTFHAAHPTQPMMATECCSCMSQRGVDTDACPDPKDGGCVGYEKAGLPNGTFYNNNIGECTAKQVAESDSRDFVTGTFVWSGFDCEFDLARRGRGAAVQLYLETLSVLGSVGLSSMLCTQMLLLWPALPLSVLWLLMPIARAFYRLR